MLLKNIQLTVFTPTYNRAYILPQLYNSLLNQTNKGFTWLIVDDGSADDTKNLVNMWKKDAPFEIIYIYQENQGMHGAHNTAYKNCRTPYNICIDSDDFMPIDAVERILGHLNDLPIEFAGLIGLDADKNTSEIIGTPIPTNLGKVKLNEIYTLHGVKGDKKLVYRTDVISKYPPYPLFKGERFVPLDYLYLLIDQDYFLKPVNEVFCIVEYQDDGSTKNIFKQYVKNPRGFAFSRLSRIEYGVTIKERFKNAIHLVSSAIFAKDINILFESKRKNMVLAAIPGGIILNIYIRMKTKT